MQHFDVFPKTRSELSERTLSGALISLVSILLIGWAAVGEIRDCVRVVTVRRAQSTLMGTRRLARRSSWKCV